MRRRFWIPILLSVPITVVAVVAAFCVVWLDPGPIPDEGNRWGFAILFPYAILIAFLRHFEDGNTDFFFIAPVLLQFPVYGLVLAVANLKGKLRSAFILLSVLHLLTIATTLLAVRLLRPPLTEANSYRQRNPTMACSGRGESIFSMVFPATQLHKFAPRR